MIAIASDHHGVAMKKAIIDHLTKQGIEVSDCGSNGAETVEYPVFIRRAAKLVQSGACERAVVICGTGVGASIVANKVRGVRCALCSDLLTAKLTRMHNDSNAVAFGADVIAIPYAIAMLDVWLSTGFEGGRHSKRVEMIHQIETEE